jgi:glutaredoxin
MTLAAMPQATSSTSLPVSPMKFVFRLFFKILRLIIGPLLLLWEMVTRPPGQARLAAVQEAVDQECRSMVLYQYRTCPFCIKVRQEMCRLSLNIEQLDAQPDGRHRDELVRGGGQAKVPCLKITDPAGNSQWLYESGKIVDYLRGRFAAV